MADLRGRNIGWWSRAFLGKLRAVPRWKMDTAPTRAKAERLWRAEVPIEPRHDRAGIGKIAVGKCSSGACWEQPG
jgi:hypothetical protein